MHSKPSTLISTSALDANRRARHYNGAAAAAFHGIDRSADLFHEIIPSLSNDDSYRINRQPKRAHIE
jgi:hypothetical protein